MPLILFAAQVSRCATTSFCPTDAELIAAIRERRNAVDLDAMREANAKDRRFIHLVTPERILSVQDVHCGEPRSDIPGVGCSLTVRYGAHNEYEVARFRREGTRWKIEKEMVVSRKRQR